MGGDNLGGAGAQCDVGAQQLRDPPAQQHRILVHQRQVDEAILGGDAGDVRKTVVLVARRLLVLFPAGEHQEARGDDIERDGQFPPIGQDANFGRAQTAVTHRAEEGNLFPTVSGGEHHRRGLASSQGPHLVITEQGDAEGNLARKTHDNLVTDTFHTVFEGWLRGQGHGEQVVKRVLQGIGRQHSGAVWRCKNNQIMDTAGK